MEELNDTNKKQQVLFVYYDMVLGGSTTSLLSLLDKFDYDKYEVDLILYRNEGAWFDYIPEKVNVLPQANIVKNRAAQLVKCIFNGSLPKANYQAFKYRKRFKPMHQSMAYTQLSFCRRLEKEYDIAIGFLELWADVYMNECVKAKKKISWVHVDYEKAHYIPDIDRRMFAKSDSIVHVSTECKENFERSFPELKEKCHYIENILTKQFIYRRMSRAKDIECDVDGTFINLLSVCRLAMDHKGLDRGVRTIKKLKDDGFDIKWYIVGEGPDREKLVELIRSLELENDVVLLGAMECPYPLFDKFDAFFLPSRFEGKPMAVTEALMLELPPIVANYASANEQIRDGYDGLIAENSEDGIYKCLRKVCENTDILKDLKKNIAISDYDNLDQIEKVYNLM